MTTRPNSSTIYVDIIQKYLEFAEMEGYSVAQVREGIKVVYRNYSNLIAVDSAFVNVGILALKEHENFCGAYPSFQELDGDTYIETVVSWLIDLMVTEKHIVLSPFVNPYYQMVDILYTYIRQWDTWTEFNYNCIAEAVCCYLAETSGTGTYEFNVEPCIN